MNTHHPLIIEPIPAFKDNYIWALRRDTQLAIVDPGDAAPVFAYMQQRKLTLTAILTTHHHADHVEGNLALRQQFGCQIVGPKEEADRIPGIRKQVAGGETFAWAGREVKVYACPGHTKGHIAYHIASEFSRSEEHTSEL